MRRLILLLLLILPTLAFAQRGEWTSYPDHGCIGGDNCRRNKLRVALVDRPVLSIRFHAHDAVGQKAEGAIRVKIDGNVVRGYLDIPRRGETFTMDVDELRGRFLVFEPVNDDEVEITDIAVMYTRQALGRLPGDRNERDDRGDRGGRGDRSGPGWREYPRAAGCIGGDECRKNGKRITIPLDDLPVLGVRFYAHDSIGTKADGKLTVRIDDTNIGWHVDIQRAGKLHEFDVDAMYGSKLVLETANDDEVDVKNIEILYGRAGRRGGSGGRRGGPREISHQGGCIGGSECGGRRSGIEIDLDGRPVESLRFYARDDVGTRADGRLRIRIDDETIEYSLDIKREGRTHTIDCRNIAGDTLFIEPANDDEVVLRDIRVKFRDED
jgi:hypothetical protein